MEPRTGSNGRCLQPVLPRMTWPSMHRVISGSQSTMQAALVSSFLQPNNFPRHKHLRRTVILTVLLGQNREQERCGLRKTIPQYPASLASFLLSLALWIKVTSRNISPGIPAILLLTYLPSIKRAISGGQRASMVTLAVLPSARLLPEQATESPSTLYLRLRVARIVPTSLSLM